MGQRWMIAITAAIVSAAIAAAQTPGAQPAAAAAQAAPAKAVDLSTEPSRAGVARTPATLREAAATNDFESFAALVRKAKANGEDIGAYTDLYDVWSYAESNATGAYYGAAVHDRLAARYPDYAKFIADYRITDKHGQAFYPSGETRNFLLQQAFEGNDPVVAAPARAVARVKPAAAVAPEDAGFAAKVTAALNAAPALKAPQSIEPPETLPADALASDMNKVTPPQPAPAARPSHVAAEMADTAGTTRGIFLIILGLVGIGVLTMTMQASASDIHVADDDDRVTPVVIAPPHDAQPTESHG